MGAGRSSSNAGSLTRLRDVVAAFPGRAFVVLDGGQFPNLPTALQRDRLFARSLYLDAVDSEVQAAGPWLMKLDQAPNVLDRVFALVGASPAAVYWCCNEGEAVLWKHLRGLAMVQIPDWAARNEFAPSNSGEEENNETVFFRHFDPRVLGAMLPVLEAAQLRRMLGPASELAFVASDFGGLRRLISDADWPRPLPGLLSISTPQIEAMNGRRLRASHRRIASYLRSVAPDDVGAASDADLLQHVEISDQTGRQLGIMTEAGHCRWSLLMLLTNGKILQHHQACAFISQGPNTPDRQVESLISLAAASMRYELNRRGVSA